MSWLSERKPTLLPHDRNKHQPTTATQMLHRKPTAHQHFFWPDPSLRMLKPLISSYPTFASPGTLPIVHQLPSTTRVLLKTRHHGTVNCSARSTRRIARLIVITVRYANCRGDPPYSSGLMWKRTNNESEDGVTMHDIDPTAVCGRQDRISCW